VDSPWRPVNCVQETGLPDTDMSAVRGQFYDTTHALRMEPQKLYMTRVLDELGGNSSVVFMPAKEFRGPLAWTRKWADTIVEWEKKNNRQVHIGLLGKKEVLDAILKDPARGPEISVINLRPWCFWDGGAPAQPERAYHKIRPCRDRYPDKAIISGGGKTNAWPVFMAGGAIALYSLDFPLYRQDREDRRRHDRGWPGSNIRNARRRQAVAAVAGPRETELRR